MKKPQKPWRLLGFSDRHLFRSLNVVAGVGYSTGYLLLFGRDTKSDAIFCLRQNGSRRARQLIYLLKNRKLPRIAPSLKVTLKPRARFARRKPCGSNPIPALPKASKTKKAPTRGAFSFCVRAIKKIFLSFCLRDLNFTSHLIYKFKTFISDIDFYWICFACFHIKRCLLARHSPSNII